MKFAKIFSRLFAAAALVGAALPAQAADKLPELHIDYSYITPATLVLKRNGWLEEALKADGTQVKWVLSQGSNRALEYLNAGSLDIGATSLLAALAGRSNGIPIKTVYVGLRSSQLGILVGKDSPIKSVADLKGKKIAAFKGTMPYFYLLSTLSAAGVSRNDVEIVSLAPPDGQAALEAGRVDAWSGLDPFHASSELNAGSRFIDHSKDPDIGVFNAREEFLQRYPDQTRLILAAFDRASRWIVDHPEETAQLIAEEGKQTLPVAKLQLSRQDYRSSAKPGADLEVYLKKLAPTLLEEGIVKKGTDVNAVIGQLLEPKFVSAGK